MTKLINTRFLAMVIAIVLFLTSAITIVCLMTGHGKVALVFAICSGVLVGVLLVLLFLSLLIIDKNDKQKLKANKKLLNYYVYTIVGICCYIATIAWFIIIRDMWYVGLFFVAIGSLLLEEAEKTKKKC